MPEPAVSLRSCHQRSKQLRIEAAMTLRTKLFALTYDRQIARTERAGLRAFRQDLHYLHEYECPRGDLNPHALNGH